MRIVEFGSGALPIFELSRTVNAQLQSGAQYIGIDLDTKRENFRTESHTQFIKGDLFRIPLRNGIADQIWLVNVFSGGIIRPPERLENGQVVYTIGGLEKDIFQQMGKLLTPKGKMFIGEWYPRYGKVEWLKSGDYEKSGLTKHVYEGMQFYDFINVHKIYTYRIYADTPPFIITLTKTS